MSDVNFDEPQVGHAESADIFALKAHPSNRRVVSHMFFIFTYRTLGKITNIFQHQPAAIYVSLELIVEYLILQICPFPLT